MNVSKITIIFTVLSASLGFAANTAESKISNDKRIIKSGLVSKSKFKSDVKSINAKTTNTTSKKSTATPSADSRNQGKLSTNIDFNDQLVGGKYQSPMEALSVVEDEKSIDDLIGVRKNFQDREQRSKAMR